MANHAYKHKSLVLAALDVPASGDEPDLLPLSLLKRKSSPFEAQHGSHSKRRAVVPPSGRARSTAQSGPVSVTSTGSGFNLNYDESSPVYRIDIGGPDQDERMAEFVTKSIDNASIGVSVKDAIKYLKLADKKDFLPGMEVRLLPHQLIGCAWMLQQEREQLYKGGILADEMGLGKTVQMIALMTANQPPPKSSRKTTLIVVPAALLQQWKDEIDTKTNGVYDVHIHHGKDKLKTLDDIESKDVIITTYQTLNNDFMVPKDVDDDDEDQWLQDNGGLLSQMEWYRVVLDEAQFIRNRSTRSSKTVAKLHSKYRWMLTGTPVTNTLADIYGLLRFGRFRPYNDWEDFKKHIAHVQYHDAPLAGLRAQVILKPILLRRTKDAQLEGEPLLVLPEKTIILETLEFSKEERELYNSFEKRVMIRINKFIKEKSILKNHAVILVLILRLRQLSCHPYLILSLSDGVEDPTLIVGGDDDKELARAMSAMGHAWVSEVKQRFMARARASEFDFTDENEEFDMSCPACNDILLNDNGRILSCGHECCLDCLLDLRGASIAHNGIFGYGDERENAQKEKEYETATAKGWRSCPTCKKLIDITDNKVFKSSAFVPSQEELSAAVRAHQKEKARAKMKATSSPVVDGSSNTRLKSWDELSDSSDEDFPDFKTLLAATKKEEVKSVKSLKITDDSDEDEEMGHVSDKKGKAVEKENGNVIPQSAQILATWNRGDADMEPSTKMLALIRLLKSWSHTGDKCICYSQWTSMLDLVEILFSRYGIQNLRYDGKMNKEAREVALSTFKKAGGPKVMLISTKSGSVGLNLVSANRCVNLDLSWNYSSENQAFDRLHRLGQEKEVFIHRLVIRDTIEERMLQLQDTKIGLAEAALGEGNGLKLHKLSVQELKTLFGMGQNNNSNGNNQRRPTRQ